jgi:hypothetical protein
VGEVAGDEPQKETYEKQGRRGVRNAFWVLRVRMLSVCLFVWYEIVFAA